MFSLLRPRRWNAFYFFFFFPGRNICICIFWIGSGFLWFYSLFISFNPHFPFLSFPPSIHPLLKGLFIHTFVLFCFIYVNKFRSFSFSFPKKLCDVMYIYVCTRKKKKNETKRKEFLFYFIYNSTAIYVSYPRPRFFFFFLGKGGKGRKGAGGELFFIFFLFLFFLSKKNVK